jgi:hypothetical protein
LRPAARAVLVLGQVEDAHHQRHAGRAVALQGGLGEVGFVAVAGVVVEPALGVGEVVRRGRVGDGARGAAASGVCLGVLRGRLERGLHLEDQVGVTRRRALAEVGPVDGPLGDAARAGEGDGAEERPAPAGAGVLVEAAVLEEVVGAGPCLGVAGRGVAVGIDVHPDELRGAGVGVPVGDGGRGVGGGRAADRGGRGGDEHSTEHGGGQGGRQQAERTHHDASSRWAGDRNNHGVHENYVKASVRC